eukprot:3820581-Prymnesium_polylepis.1
MRAHGVQAQELPGRITTPVSCWPLSPGPAPSDTPPRAVRRRPRRGVMRASRAPARPAALACARPAEEGIPAQRSRAGPPLQDPSARSSPPPLAPLR